MVRGGLSTGGVGTVRGVDVLLEPVALVTADDGARLVEVDEVDGVIVERASGVPVDLVSLVVVVGLPELAAA